MSGKKSSPALYELYHKGKSSRGGLFSRRKKLNINNAYDIPSVPAPVSKPIGPVRPPAADRPVLPDTPADSAEYDDSNVAFEVEYGRITMIMPVWLFIMVVMAVLTSLLAAYKLGATSGGNVAGAVKDSGTTAVDDDPRLDAQPSQELIAALNTEPVGGLVNNSEVLQDTIAEAKANGTEIIERPARCIIVFGIGSELESLQYVQEYFASQGLSLEIVKRNGTKGYILVTRDGFDSTKDHSYLAMKSKIKTIGKSYILNRENGWPRITIDTFDDAYPIDTNKLIYEW